MSGVTLGKYRFIAELGRGGMAEVFLAVVSAAEAGFSKLVVLKKPRAHLADDMDFITMFVDEARIAARLNHPNLVQTLEVGEVGSQYYLTMEYLDGQPLHRILNRGSTTIPLPMHVGILCDVLAGIHSAHELKDYDGQPLHVVHRDVTPHNVFVTYDGQVKVVDFGIAKAVGRISETRHGVVKGKTPYMAPEQASSQPVDRRVDIFAVGVMLYEAIVGRRMWKGVSETDIIRRLLTGAIPSSPKELVPDVDDELDQICRRALAAAPGDRFQTAAEMQDALEAYLGRQPTRYKPRDLGNFVAGLFADKREATNKIIESQLSHLRADSRSTASRLSLGRFPPSSTASPDSSAFDSTPSRTSTAATAPPSEAARLPPPPSRQPAFVRQAATPSRGSGASLAPPPSLAPGRGAPRHKSQGSLPPGRRRGLGPIAPLIIAASVLAVATTALTIVGLSMSRASNGNGSTKSAIPAGKKVTVTLRATPLETSFSIDGGPPLENPFIGQFDADDREHVIRAVAPGMMPQVRTVRFVEDEVSMRFSLSAARPVGSSAPPRNP